MSQEMVEAGVVEALTVRVSDGAGASGEGGYEGGGLGFGKSSPGAAGGFAGKMMRRAEQEQVRSSSVVLPALPAWFSNPESPVSPKHRGAGGPPPEADHSFTGSRLPSLGGGVGGGGGDGGSGSGGGGWAEEEEQTPYDTIDYEYAAALRSGHALALRPIRTHSPSCIRTHSDDS